MMETDYVISKWLFEDLSNAGYDVRTARNGC